LDAVEDGVGKSKQKRFLSLPRGLAIWRAETTELKWSRLIVNSFYS
jgi:hypothetical protein